MDKAVDFANYTAIPTPEQVRCLLENGYTRAIVGVSYGFVARPQLEVCAKGGMDIEAYAWVRFSDLWRIPLDKALNVIGGLPVKRLWLDCEENTQWPPDKVLDRIAEAEVYVRNQRIDLDVGIYTGAWWWKPHTNDSERFSALPLWFASYREPNIDYRQLLFGGWTEAAMWQYAGTVETCGLNTDRNVILEARVKYTDEKLDEAFGEVLKQLGSLGAKIDTLGQAADAVIDHNDVKKNTPLNLRGLFYVAGKAWPFG